MSVVAVRRGAAIGILVRLVLVAIGAAAIRSEMAPPRVPRTGSTVQVAGLDALGTVPAEHAGVCRRTCEGGRCQNEQRGGADCELSVLLMSPNSPKGHSNRVAGTSQAQS